MSDFFFALVADYGVPIVFVVTFLSCLDLPVPSSILMLTSGGFAATGDLTLSTVLAAAFIGAVLGDNAGYWIARASGDRMQNWLEKKSQAQRFTPQIPILHGKMGRRVGVLFLLAGGPAWSLRQLRQRPHALHLAPLCTLGYRRRGRLGQPLCRSRLHIRRQHHLNRQHA
jgi:membrane protein YqaA with SNARE-associated domain